MWLSAHLTIVNDTNKYRLSKMKYELYINFHVMGGFEVDILTGQFLLIIRTTAL